MSVPPEPPERLTEILLEILALSDSTRTSQSESVSGSLASGSSDAHCDEQQPQRRDEEDDAQQEP